MPDTPPKDLSHEHPAEAEPWICSHPCCGMCHSLLPSDIDRIIAERSKFEQEVIDLKKELAETKTKLHEAVDTHNSLTAELWEGVRIHGLKAPPENKAREGERLIHAYCGGIVRAQEEAELAREQLFDAGMGGEGKERTLHALVCEALEELAKARSYIGVNGAICSNTAYADAWRMLAEQLGVPPPYTHEQARDFQLMIHVGAEWARQAVATRIQTAVEAEREACALIAERGDDIPARIRERVGSDE